MERIIVFKLGSNIGRFVMAFFSSVFFLSGKRSFYFPSPSLSNFIPMKEISLKKILVIHVTNYRHQVIHTEERCKSWIFTKWLPVLQRKTRLHLLGFFWLKFLYFFNSILYCPLQAKCLLRPVAQSYDSPAVKHFVVLIHHINCGGKNKCLPYDFSWNFFHIALSYQILK